MLLQKKVAHRLLQTFQKNPPETGPKRPSLLGPPETANEAVGRWTPSGSSRLGPEEMPILAPMALPLNSNLQDPNRVW